MNYVLQVLFILVLMTVGYVARKRGVVSAVGTSEMVRVLISIIYPCLIFSSVTKLNAQELAANWMMPVLALGIAGTGLILGLLAVRCMKGVDQQRASALWAGIGASGPRKNSAPLARLRKAEGWSSLRSSARKRSASKPSAGCSQPRIRCSRTAKIAQREKF